MNNYFVRAFYNDSEISVKKVKGESQDITMVHADYTLRIQAEDMKKAIDIAIQYMPVGAKIRMVEEDNSMCSNSSF